jgi:hypothetical protein
LTKEEILQFFQKQGKDELPEGLWETEDKVIAVNGDLNWNVDVMRS